MIPSMIALFAIICSYLIGSIPSAFIVVKWAKKVDIRTIGSGNVGATNVTRALGFKAGVVVFFLDLIKGMVSTLLFASWLDQTTLTFRLVCGLFAVLGHIFPIFLKFQGGKGVATTMGVLATTMPVISAMALGIWFVCFALWRYVSVGSIAAISAVPLLQLLTQQSAVDVVLGAALAMLIVVKHRSNIERLLRGDEHKFGTRKNS